MKDTEQTPEEQVTELLAKIDEIWRNAGKPEMLRRTRSYDDYGIKSGLVVSVQEQQGLEVLIPDFREERKLEDMPPIEQFRGIFKEQVTDAYVATEFPSVDLPESERLPALLKIIKEYEDRTPCDEHDEESVFESWWELNGCRTVGDPKDYALAGFKYAMQRGGGL